MTIQLRNLKYERPLLYPKQRAAIFDPHRYSLIEATNQSRHDSRKPAGETNFFGHVWCPSVNRFSELFGVPGAFGVYCHSYFPASP
jgi:hypothetical protein